MNIEKLGFEIPIFVSHLEHHDELKKELLEVIRTIDAPRVSVRGTPISQSSFGNPALNQKWRPIFMKAARRHLVDLFLELKTPQWDVMQMWFQSYESGNLHRAHTTEPTPGPTCTTWTCPTRNSERSSIIHRAIGSNCEDT